MKRLAICLTLSLFAAEASALELSFDQESRALVAVGVPEQAPPDPKADEVPGEVVAPVAEAPTPRELWRIPWLFRSEEKLPQPVVARVDGEEVVVFCVSSYLYEASARTGAVQFRKLLPGKCKGLALEGPSKVSATLFTNVNWTWSAEPNTPDIVTFAHTVGDRTRELIATPKVESDSLLTSAQARMRLYDAAEEEGPTELNAYSEEGRDWADHRLTYGEAPERTMSMEGFDEMSAWRTETPEGKAWSKRALETLRDARAQDPTNPHYDFIEGVIHWEFGRKDEALAAWKPLKTVPQDIAHETILMLPKLARVGAPPELVESIRANVTSALLRGGFDPQFNSSSIWLIINWRSTSPGLDPTDERARAIADSYAEDWFAMTPRVGMTRPALRALADGHRAAGNQARAQELDGRVDAIRDLMRSTHPDMAWPLYALPFPAAFVLTALCLMLLGVLRRFGARHVPRGTGPMPPLWLKFNPLSTADRGALVVMFGLLVGAAFITWKMTLGVAYVGVAAGAPEPMLSGQFEDPRVLKYLEDSPPSDPKTFYLALHHHKAGDAERARELYASMGTARALNNIGVLAHQAGDAEGAQAAWDQAATLDPDLEALVYNTRGEATGHASRRVKKYAPELKMLAPPTHQDFQLFIESKADVSFDALLGMFGTPSDYGDVFLGDGPQRLPGGLSLGGLVPLLLLLLFGLLAPRRGHVITARSFDDGKPAAGLSVVGVTGWVLGLLTPGGARALGALGPVLLATTLVSAGLRMATSYTGGSTSSIMIYLDVTSTIRFLGIKITAADIAAPIDQTLIGLGESWWLIALGSVALGAVAEVVRPDPVGLLARRSARNSNDD